MLPLPVHGDRSYLTGTASPRVASRKRKPAAADPDTVLKTHCPASEVLIWRSLSALQLADSSSLQVAHTSTLLHKLKGCLSDEITTVVRNSYAVGKTEQRVLSFRVPFLLLASALVAFGVPSWPHNLPWA